MLIVMGTFAGGDLESCPFKILEYFDLSTASVAPLILGLVEIVIVFVFVFVSINMR